MPDLNSSFNTLPFSTHSQSINTMNTKYLLLAIAIFSAEVSANSTLDAAIGGGLGGAVGAAIGNELSGRDGAVVGGAIGGAVGTAINTDNRDNHSGHQRPREREYTRVIETHTIEHRGYHCPPGQAKKDRC